jgi:hypothetical protein
VFVLSMNSLCLLRLLLNADMTRTIKFKVDERRPIEESVVFIIDNVYILDIESRPVASFSQSMRVLLDQHSPKWGFGL